MSRRILIACDKPVFVILQPTDTFTSSSTTWQEENWLSILDRSVNLLFLEKNLRKDPGHVCHSRIWNGLADADFRRVDYDVQKNWQLAKDLHLPYYQVYYESLMHYHTHNHEFFMKLSREGHDREWYWLEWLLPICNCFRHYNWKSIIGTKVVPWRLFNDSTFKTGRKEWSYKFRVALPLGLMSWSWLLLLQRENKVPRLAGSMAWTLLLFGKTFVSVEESWIDLCSAGTGGAELAKAADEISLLDIHRCAECLGSRSIIWFQDNPNPWPNWPQYP